MDHLELSLSAIVPLEKQFSDLDVGFSSTDLDKIGASMREHRLHSATLQAEIRNKDPLLTTFGLIQPMLVYYHEGQYKLVDGLKRFAILSSEGWERCFFRQVSFASPAHARLAYLDQHLVRQEFDVVQRGRMYVERERLLAEIGQRTKRGYPYKDRQNSGGLRTSSDLAEEAGVSTSAYRQTRRIASVISPAAYERAKSLGVENSSYVLAYVVKGDPSPEEQISRLEEIETMQTSGTVSVTAGLKAQSSAPPAQKPPATDANIVQFPSVTPGSRRVKVAKGEKWRVSDHEFYCVDSQTFLEQHLVDEVSLGIVNINCAKEWQHDSLIEKCRTVAVFCPGPEVFGFARRTELKYRGEIISFPGRSECLFVCLFSKSPCPIHLVKQDSSSDLLTEVIIRIAGSNQTISIPNLNGELYDGLLQLPPDLKYKIVAATQSTKELGRHLALWKAQNRNPRQVESSKTERAVV